MNRIFRYAVAAVCGSLFVAPVLAMAQVDLDTRAIASSTAAEVRATVEVEVPASFANIENRLRSAKERAQAELERRTTGLTKLLDRISAMKRVSESFKSDLRATVDAQIQSIEALGQKIEEGTSTSTLREDIQSITRSYRIFALVMPQAQIAAAADRLVTITATLSEIGGKLSLRVRAAGEAGNDTGELTAALQSLSAHIDAGNAYAQAAVAGTATLEADQGDTAIAEANRTALQTAREKLRLAHEEVRAGREDVASIIESLKNLSAVQTQEEISTP